VVVGGGFTGIEAAAEIAERRPGVDVTLLSSGPVATQMRPQARRSIRRALTRLGVHLVEDATAERITDRAVRSPTVARSSSTPAWSPCPSRRPIWRAPAA
jgi:NADH dehydrogenase